jgi:hypothetical protein
MTELEFPLFSGNMSQMYIQIIHNSVLQPVEHKTPHSNLSLSAVYTSFMLYIILYYIILYYYILFSFVTSAKLLTLLSNVRQSTHCCFTWLLIRNGWENTSKVDKVLPNTMVKLHW